MFDLKGKVALVAGGAGYLGTSVCESLIGQGASVMIADMNIERAEALAESLRSAGGTAAAVEMDGADEESLIHSVQHTCKTFGRLDSCIVMTYHAIGSTVDQLTVPEFDAVNHVNLTGTFVLVRAAADAMEEGGSIVLFTSMYGQVSPDPRTYLQPMKPNPIEYGVGKAGVIQMMKYLAVTWGPRGIRVNAISPGPFPNPDAQKNSPDFVQRLAEKVPMGRVGQAPEIAGPVVLLASDESSFINGTVINIDGGWMAW